ncbi:Cyclin-T1-5 [Dichanthelium oligosanthes]|uniref:Cyclin-T1-5 n=1 Tax=Dichanthelium oligosanthes TaxID=888268 RepID=A0A1E5VI97_9POAL|nr:Cyclin-T1-5 [Dichanthelium oligosanthes]
MSFQSFAPGPATHHPHPYPYHQDPSLRTNTRRRRRRDHDDPYHLNPVLHVHPCGTAAAVTGTVPYHVPRDPLALSHIQERLFPPPQPHPTAGPPPPKRARRAPDLRWDPPPLAPVLAASEPREGGAAARALLSRDEIERRSPSRRDGIDSALEARLRASYCAYLRCLGIRLGLPQTTIATAVVFCHQFFFHRSHACHDRFLVATAALFLAAKSEETACLLNTVLRASCEVSQNQEFNLLPYILRDQDWFEQYRESVIQAEQMILTTLDFELEVVHPYASLSSALSKLGLSHTVLFNVAWNLINEGLQSSLWLQFKPPHIAAGAAFLAAKFLCYDITFHPNFWHEFKTTPYIVQDVVQQLKELL